MKSRGNAFNRRVTLNAEETVGAAQAIADIRKNLNSVQKPPHIAPQKEPEVSEHINPFLAAKKMEAKAMEPQGRGVDQYAGAGRGLGFQNSNPNPNPSGRAGGLPMSPGMGRAVGIPGMNQNDLGALRGGGSSGTITPIVLKHTPQAPINQDAVQDALPPKQVEAPKVPNLEGQQFHIPKPTQELPRVGTPISPRAVVANTSMRGGLPVRGGGSNPAIVPIVVRGGRGPQVPAVISPSLNSSQGEISVTKLQPQVLKPQISPKPIVSPMPHSPPMPQTPPMPQAPQAPNPNQANAAMFQSKGKGYRPPTDEEAWNARGFEGLDNLVDEMNIEGIDGPVNSQDLDSFLSDF